MSKGDNEKVRLRKWVVKFKVKNHKIMYIKEKKYPNYMQAAIKFKLIVVTQKRDHGRTLNTVCISVRT